MMGKSVWLYAARALVRVPGFTLAVVVSLTLGIGANAAIFSVVNGLLFHPSGIRRPEELVAPRVDYKKLNLDKIAMSAPDFADILQRPDVFSHAAIASLDGFNYTSGNSPERLEGALVSWQWFQVFGSEPVLGRGFHREEDAPGANHIAVLSFKTWKRLFGGSSKVVGQTIELNKTPYRVIGVMPPDFRWPSEADLWIPLGLAPKEYGPAYRFNERFLVFARLAPGVSLERAATVVHELSRRVLDQTPFARGSQWSMVLEPMTEYAAGDLKRPMLLLLSAVAFVLLIACCNIAGLMLMRATSRARELAIRVALGASRTDLVMQALAETSLLSLLGTALGFGLAFSILDALLSLAHNELSTQLYVQIDGHVLAFTACIGLFCALAFGLAPAWHVSSLGQQQDQLKAGGRWDTESHDRQKLRSTLVAGQIALALVLLVGAGLLFKTLTHLRNVNTGFDGRQVMTASIALPTPEYSDPDKEAAFFHSVLDQLSNSPGVLGAAAANAIPFIGGDPTASFAIEGRITAPTDPGFHGSQRSATPDYFRALKIPLLAGRLFDDRDRRGGQPVAIIDQALAQRYWPKENPIGHRIRGSSRDPWATIIGVVGHVKQSSLSADSGRGAYYYCLYQRPETEAFLVVRGVIPAAQLRRAIRSAVRAADPAQAVFDMRSMEERIASALGPEQFAVQLLTVFAGAALLLAAIGLYGIVGYSVMRRTREIGIRAALGADRSAILSLVMGQVFRLLAAGVACGFVIAALLGSIAASQLFDVSPFDVPTFGVTTLVLVIAATLAASIPAWRATRVDPVTALRNE